MRETHGYGILPPIRVVRVLTSNVPWKIVCCSLQVDPEIIGGMIVNIGEKYVDMSIASKVKTYSKLISDPI